MGEIRFNVQDALRLFSIGRMRVIDACVVFERH
jgi:hypothetical protein